MPDTSLRFLLRDRTAALHAELDRSVGTFDGLETYRSYLRCLYGFRAPVEAAVALSAWPDWFGDWAPGAIADAIHADMFDLGAATPTPCVHVHSQNSLDLADPSRLMGALYVLEGASLGARLLYRRAQAIGLSAGHGARHLAQQSDERDRWRQFVGILEQSQHVDVEATVRASLLTFELALGAFSKDGDDEQR